MKTTKKRIFHNFLLDWYISSERFFCSLQERKGMSKVELLFDSGVDAEFYGESFGDKI
jgi:hypothetical protein